MKQKTIRGDTCTYNEYMHIAQALRTLIIEDRKSIRRFYGSRLSNYQSETINFFIETGRWINTNKNLRKRTMCDCNGTGYEFYYYIFECTHFVNDRKEFSSKRYCMS